MTKKTLLEIAKETGTRKIRIKFSDQEIELALAYINGEVGIVQAMKALQEFREMKTTSPAYVVIANCLRYAISTGKIKIQ